MYVVVRRNNRNFPQNQSMLTQKCVTENFQARSQEAIQFLLFCYCLLVLLLLIEKKRVEDKNTYQKNKKKGSRVQCFFLSVSTFFAEII